MDTIKKLAKLILAGAITTGITAPFATLSQTAFAATVRQSLQTFTSADTNYVNYNSNYFTTVEQAGNDAKSFYFHSFQNFLAESDNVHQAKLANAALPATPYLDKYVALQGKWLSISGAAWRPGIDVPSKFKTADQYYHLAVQAQNAQKKAYDDYIRRVFVAIRDYGEYSKNGNTFALNLTTQKANVQETYNRLVQGENDYAKYKKLYLAEIDKLKQNYAPAPTAPTPSAPATKTTSPDSVTVKPTTTGDTVTVKPPVATAPAPVSTPMTQTQGYNSMAPGPAYVQAVGHYFTVVEQNAYTAKAWYFHNHAEFVATKGLVWNDGMGQSEGQYNDYAPDWVKKFGDYTGKWYQTNHNFNAMAPAAYSLADKYVRLAVEAQRFEQQAFNDYVLCVSQDLVNKKNAANEADIKDAYNRLVIGERNYQIYKNLYLNEYVKLNK